MMQEIGDHSEIKQLLEENLKVAKENHEYLRKLYRNSMISGIFQIVWYAILIGVPFAFYYYIAGPYFEALGADFEQFMSGINELPGIKSFEKFNQ